MPIFELFAIAVGLAMDAFAVSIATGIRLGCVTGRQTFRMAFHFGFFQFMMPVFGWFAGTSTERFSGAFDHWIAMGLLSFIGGKMIREALKRDDSGACTTSDPTRGVTLLGLAVATSIDAFAVGFGLSLLKVDILWPAAAIGIVCFAFTAAGLHLGRLLSFSERIGRWSEAAGGIILLAIGANILRTHGIG